MCHWMIHIPQIIMDGWFCIKSILVESHQSKPKHFTECSLTQTDLIEVVRLNLLYQRSHRGHAIEFVIPTISLRSIVDFVIPTISLSPLLNLLYQRSHWGLAVEFVIPTISLRSCGWICYTNDLIEVVRLNLLYQRSHWGRAVEFVIPTISLRSIVEFVIPTISLRSIVEFVIPTISLRSIVEFVIPTISLSSCRHRVSLAKLHNCHLKNIELIFLVMISWWHRIKLATTWTARSFNVESSSELVNCFFFCSPPIRVELARVLIVLGMFTNL